MHLNALELERIPLRWATQPLGLRWGFEATLEIGVAIYTPEIIPSEPDLGNSSEGNVQKRSVSNHRSSRFPLEAAFFVNRGFDKRQSGRN